MGRKVQFKDACRSQIWALALLAIASAGLSGCLTAVILNEGECALSGGEGYRVSSSAVELTVCDRSLLTGLNRCALREADPSTFRSLGSSAGKWWGADEHHVYANCRSVPGASPVGFSLPTRLGGSDYSRAGNHVLWRTSLLLNADPASFEALSPLYARDRSTVWHAASPVTEADPSTFAVVFDQKLNHFARDERRVYRGGEVVEGADPQGFAVLVNEDNDTLYFADGRAVFTTLGGIVPGSHPASFEALGSGFGFARDRSQAYFRGRVLPGADAATFEVIGFHRGADSENVWYRDRQIVGADPKSFRQVEAPGVLPMQIWSDARDTFLFDQPLGIGPVTRAESIGDYLALDERVVFCDRYQDRCCGVRVLPHLRADRLTVADGPYVAGDGFVFYRGEQLAGADFESFVGFGSSSFAKDSSTVYWSGQPIPGADAASFKVERTRSGWDRHGGYSSRSTEDSRRVLHCPAEGSYTRECLEAQRTSPCR